MRFDSLRTRCVVASLIVALLAAGCGQRGPLVLPGTPPVPASSETEEDAQEDDESETDGER